MHPHAYASTDEKVDSEKKRCVTLSTTSKTPDVSEHKRAQQDALQTAIDASAIKGEHHVSTVAYSLNINSSVPFTQTSIVCMVPISESQDFLVYGSYYNNACPIGRLSMESGYVTHLTHISNQIEGMALLRHSMNKYVVALSLCNDTVILCSVSESKCVCILQTCGSPNRIITMDGKLENATFNCPKSLAYDSKDNLLVYTYIHT
jgi:hypothetical protein